VRFFGRGWIGRIDLLDARTSGRTPDELKAEIDRRRNESGGDETWVLGSGDGPGGRQTVVLADASLKRIDHPFADHHVEIGVVLQGPGGPRDDAEAAALRELGL